MCRPKAEQRTGHALVIWLLLPRQLLGAAQAEAARIAPCVGFMHNRRPPVEGGRGSVEESGASVIYNLAFNYYPCCLGSLSILDL